MCPSNPRRRSLPACVLSTILAECHAEGNVVPAGVYCTGPIVTTIEGRR
jgi:hypothetical protein